MKLAHPLLALWEAVEAPADWLVSWAWDAFGLRRVWFMRVLLAAVLALNILNAAWLGLPIIAVCAWMEERLAATGDAAINARMAVGRSVWPMALMVLGFLAGLAWSGLIDSTLRDKLFDVVMIAYIVFSWTFAPNRPRRRRERLVLAPESI